MTQNGGHRLPQVTKYFDTDKYANHFNNSDYKIPKSMLLSSI